MTSPNFFPICTTLRMGVSLKKYKGIKTSSLRVLTLVKDLFHYCVTHKKAIFAKFSILHVFEGGAFDILKK